MAFSVAEASRKIQIRSIAGEVRAAGFDRPIWVDRDVAREKEASQQFILQPDVGYEISASTAPLVSSIPSTVQVPASVQDGVTRCGVSLETFPIERVLTHSSSSYNPARRVAIYLVDTGVDPTVIKQLYPRVQVTRVLIKREDGDDFKDLGIEDDAGHGTSVAMTILAVLAPQMDLGMEVALYSWKVLDANKKGFLSLLDPALNQVAFHMEENPFKATHMCLNMSLALDENDVNSQRYSEETLNIKLTIGSICELNMPIWVTIAAGNRTKPVPDLAVPARFVRDRKIAKYSAIVVVRAAYSGHKVEDLLQSSRRCDQGVDFCRCVSAPGYRVGIPGYTPKSGDDGGTSIATAIVTGLLLASKQPGTTQTHVPLHTWFASNPFVKILNPVHDAQGRLDIASLGNAANIGTTATGVRDLVTAISTQEHVDKGKERKLSATSVPSLSAMPSSLPKSASEHPDGVGQNRPCCCKII